MTKRLYDNAKIFHFADKLADLAAGRVSPPVHVRLKPTNHCNHRCCYCCYRNEKLELSERMDERDEIPPTKMREIVADLAGMGVRAVTLSGGGEPLCYAAIGETVAGLLDSGVKVAMLTHGGLLDGDVARLLARRATWVRVSMDAADRDTYARTRRVAPAEFDRVCENVRRFAAADGRRCVIGLNFIVTAENHDQVGDFLRMAKRLGADHVKVSAAVVSTDAAENAAYVRPWYETVKRQVAEGAAALADERFAVIDKVHLPDAGAERFERQYTWCPFARCLTVIAADLNVYACQDKAYTQAGLLGSIRDRRFAELWASEELRRRLAAIDPRTDCRHHCVAHAKNLMLLDYLEADQEHLDFV
jgi:MoaA/NifB/PqqE/SkfB family radical SAM enzyme